MASQRPIVAVFAVLALVLCAFLAPTFGGERKSCSKCAMELDYFAHSIVEAAKDGGGAEVFCSLACAVSAVDPDKVPAASFRVADYDTRELLEAEKAVWVVGGSKPGVMTPRAKWAFATKERAEKFVKSYGGEVGDWRFALAAAREDERKTAEEAKSFFDK